jgi:hypothetical protein
LLCCEFPVLAAAFACVALDDEHRKRRLRYDWHRVNSNLSKVWLVHLALDQAVATRRLDPS